MSATRRIALVPSEPIRATMAGIGIRYHELAQRLPREGIEVVVVNPGDLDAARELLPDTELRRFDGAQLARQLADCDAAVTQGQLANDVLYACPELPVAVDLYDPFLVENLSYFETLGLDPYRNDHATWVHQLSRGDFFLCSSEEQRQFYLGFLAAVGRLNPPRVHRNPILDDLVALVPFGIPEALPPARTLLDPPREGERRLLFGGLYDWYDPWPVLEALASADAAEGWTLWLIHNPNPGATPQRLLGEVERWCRERGLWESRIRLLDWVPAERRYDLLREVDLMVSTHLPTLETRLSLRTRFLDALAAGCPVVTSQGGAMSRLLEQHDAGWVVPAGDGAAVAAAFREILNDPEARQRRRQGGERLLEAFRWEQVLEPLVRFCRDPWRDESKDEFASRPATTTPPDALGFRIRRFLKRQRDRLFGGGNP